VTNEGGVFKHLNILFRFWRDCSPWSFIFLQWSIFNRIQKKHTKQTGYT